jgi:hypothetical protein
MSSIQKCNKGHISISPLTTKKVLPKIYQIYETTGYHYEWQVTVDRQYTSNIQKKDARNLE